MKLYVKKLVDTKVNSKQRINLIIWKKGENGDKTSTAHEVKQNPIMSFLI